MMRSAGLATAVLAVAVLASIALAPAAALASQCLAYVQGTPEAMPARFSPVQANNSQGTDTVEITFVGHATFRIRSPGGVVIATDYTGHHGAGRVPDVVTMNHAHSSHYTDVPDPAIEHVLRGWNPQGGQARHDLEVGDVRIRNVPTDIRGWSGTVEKHGNSIFIFEMADLCIGHLGHLHHTLSREDLALIGRLDVVFAPVDGRYTMNVAAMVDVLEDLRASLVIPMHFFGGASLAQFVGALTETFELRVARDSPIRVSLASLPRTPTVLIPQGYGGALPQ